MDNDKTIIIIARDNLTVQTHGRTSEVILEKKLDCWELSRFARRSPLITRWLWIPNMAPKMVWPHRWTDMNKGPVIWPPSPHLSINLIWIHYWLCVSVCVCVDYDTYVFYKVILGPIWIKRCVSRFYMYCMSPHLESGAEWDQKSALAFLTGGLHTAHFFVPFISKIMIILHTKWSS